MSHYTECADKLNCPFSPINMGKRKEQSLEQKLAGKNPKAVIALTRRHNVAEAKKAAEAKAKEDASW